MKPKFVALNVLLALGVVAVAWQAKARWDEAQGKRRATLHVPVKPVPVPPMTAMPRPEGASALKYNEVAQKNLFSKDRDPNVVIEPPKPPEPPKPMPKLPVVYGVMGLPSGVKAVMAEKSGSSTSVVKTGDSVGEFKVLALDTQKVTFEWQDKQITKNIDELVDRSGPQDRAAAPGAAPQSASAAPEPQRQASNPGKPPEPAKGVDIGGAGGPSVKACTPGDTSPAGTVADGYKKVLEATPFGPACRWVKQ